MGWDADGNRTGFRMGTGKGRGENGTGRDRVGTEMGLGWDRDVDEDQIGMGWHRIGKGMETGWGSRLGQGMAWDGTRWEKDELGW